MSVNLKSIRMALVLTFMLIVGSIQAQTVKVTVKDTNGEPVIGASVLEKGTRNGGITDFDGRLTIKTSGKPLVISYIGMKTQTVNISGKNSITVTLQDAATSLNDIVVIGYGSVKKKDITGSVATVNSTALQAVPVANATEALTGKMAGVQITTTEGSPDADVKIRVRGGGSITQSNDPLFIVDGFPVESISDIPANDIEDITVLKDASSTAIYGSRGANGVILVTTKSGQSGKVKVSYNAYYSWKKIAKTLDVLSPADYAKWQYELAQLKGSSDNALTNYGKFFGTFQDLDLYNDVTANDWQDITFGRVGHTFNHNININGGSETIKYAFSYAHMNDKGIMIGSSYKRDNFSLKLNTKPSKNTTLDLQARYSETDIYGGGANEATAVYDSDRRLKYSVIYTPIPLRDLTAEEGSSDDDLGNLYNPVQAVYDNDREKERRNLNLAGSFGWEIFKDFKFKTEFGLDTYRNSDHRFWGTTTYYVKNVPASVNQNMPAIQLADTNRDRFRNTNTISYDFTKLLNNENHHLNAMVGHEYVITKQDVNTEEVHGFPTNYTSHDAWRLTSQGTPYMIDHFYNPDDKLLSFFGRVNYNFMDKYLLSATFRADASSKFSKENRWGYFPSAAIAWRISAEPFMKGTEKWLDDLKLRLSYGTAGNNNIPAGQLSQVYSSSTTSWINNYTSYWAPSKIKANPDLKWETTITRNLGLDFTLLRGKLIGSFETYINTTKDLLILFPISGTGYDNQYRNMGKTQNSGFEATLTWNAINKKDYGLTISGNIGFNKTKIKSLGTMADFGTETYWASSEIGNDYWVSVGGAVGEMYGYRSLGRYEVDDFEGYDATTKKWKLKEGVVDATSVVGQIRPGSMKLADKATVKNEDGTMTGNGTIGEEDKEIIGNANPDFTGGFNISARAYGFDLSANFNFSVGNDIYNANKIEFSTTGKYQYRNMLSSMADGKRWTNLRADGTISNDPTELAQMNAHTTEFSPYTSRMIFSDWAVEDGSFLRLNTLTLGYTIPAQLTNRWGISSLRFYVTTYNLFCLTSYDGYDPEVSTMRRNGSNLTPGVDYSAYPKSRQFLIGVNLNF